MVRWNRWRPSHSLLTSLTSIITMRCTGRLPTRSCTSLARLRRSMNTDLKLTTRSSASRTSSCYQTSLRSVTSRIYTPLTLVLAEMRPRLCMSVSNGLWRGARKVSLMAGCKSSSSCSTSSLLASSSSTISSRKSRRSNLASGACYLSPSPPSTLSKPSWSCSRKTERPCSVRRSYTCLKSYARPAQSTATSRCSLRAATRTSLRVLLYSASPSCCETCVSRCSCKKSAHSRSSLT